MTTPDAETISWARLIMAFAVVLAMLVGFGFILKFIKARGLVIPGINQGSGKRLQVLESLSLDVRRRLVIVRCDDAEHLLLLGPDRDIIVETRLNENQTSSSSFQTKRSA